MRNIGDLMKKAQMVQSQMTVLQNKMEKLEFEGMAANGAVKVVTTGKHVPVKVNINASVVDPSDTETLEDLVLIALKDAYIKAESMEATEMERIQTSLGLPANFKMPF